MSYDYSCLLLCILFNDITFQIEQNVKYYLHYSLKKKLFCEFKYRFCILVGIKANTTILAYE